MMHRRFLLSCAAASVSLGLLPIRAVAEPKELEGRIVARFEHHVILLFADNTRAQYNDYNVEHVSEDRYKIKLGAQPIHVFPDSKRV